MVLCNDRGTCNAGDDAEHMPARGGVGDPLKLTGEVTWRCTVQTTINKNNQAEVNPLWSG